MLKYLFVPLRCVLRNLKYYCSSFSLESPPRHRKRATTKYAGVMPLRRLLRSVFGACGEPERDMVRLRCFFIRLRHVLI